MAESPAKPAPAQSASIHVKHPKALPYLFFTELWERFGYYLMIGIFTLYMMDSETGGLGMERDEAFDIFGTFIALVFLTPFVGGMLADRVLGYRTAVIFGGLLMAVGYAGLAVPGPTAFWLSLSAIIIGNGFFKPNISTLLGNIYNAPELRAKKDSGYNIFYMGINVGAFICNFFAAYLRHNYSWGHAFMAAGIGMVIGLVVFIIGTKHYRHADVRPAPRPGEKNVWAVLGVTLAPAVLFGYLGWIIPGTIFGHDSTDAFLFGAMPVVFYYGFLYATAEKKEKKPLAAMFAIFAVVIVFWAVFKQNGTALTTWAQYYTDREIPTAIAPTVDSLRMAEKVDGNLDTVRAMDAQFRLIKDEKGNVIEGPGTNAYLKNLPFERQPGPGEELQLVSTELFQSVNPFFVVALTPVVVAFFAFLRRRKKEPTTPAKIAYGLGISALSTLIMVAAVSVGMNGAEKVSPLWLIGTYGVITIGELFLSPMGLSLVSKLSPPRMTALMMGGWFLSTSLGNKLSGVLATLWDTFENKQHFFLMNFSLLALAALTLFLLLRWLNGIFREYSGD